MNTQSESLLGSTNFASNSRSKLPSSLIYGHPLSNKQKLESELKEDEAKGEMRFRYSYTHSNCNDDACGSFESR